MPDAVMRGERVRRDLCGRTVAFDYEGGPRRLSPIELLFLALFGKTGIPGEDPTAGLYDDHKGVCPECYSSRVSAEEKLASDEILRIAEEVTRARERAASELAGILPRVLQDISSSVSREELEAIIDKAEGLDIDEALALLLGDGHTGEGKTEVPDDQSAQSYESLIGDYLTERAKLAPAVHEALSRHKEEVSLLMMGMRKQASRTRRVYLGSLRDQTESPGGSSRSVSEMRAEPREEPAEHDESPEGPCAWISEVLVPAEGSLDWVLCERSIAFMSAIKCRKLKLSDLIHEGNMTAMIREMITRLAGPR